MSRAAERCVALSLDLDKILAALRIVSCAVGSGWLVEQQRLLSLGGRTVADAHPLYSALNATSDIAIAEVCELAHYLIEFKNDPALPSVLDDLRSAKYHAIVQELAFAYRWRDAGAMVSLRPPTRDGEADFLATIANLPFTVETSLFPTDIFKHPRFRLPTIIAESLDSVLKKAPPVTVKIRILKYPPGNREAQLRAWVKDAAQAFARNPHSVYQLPEFFLRRLTEREWKWDFLGQREFPDLSIEDAARYYADRMDYPKH